MRYSIFLTILVGIAFPLYGADSLNIRTISSLPYSSATVLYMDTSSNLLFAGVGAQVRIYDMSYNNELHEVSRIDVPGYVKDIIRSGNYLYIAGYSRDLIIYDISNIYSPGLISVWDNVEGYGYSLDFDGNYIYLADGGYGVAVLDVSDPHSPVLVGEFRGLNTRGVALNGDYLYVTLSGTTFGKSFFVLDVSNPSSPSLVDTMYLGSFVPGIRLYGNHAVVHSYNDGFYILDISNPAHPALLSSVYASGVFSSCESDTFLYLASGYSGIYIYSISDLTAPQLLAQMSGDYLSWDVKSNGDRLYVADDFHGVKLMDRSDPVNPSLLDSVPLPGYSLPIALRGNTVFLGAFRGYLRILYVSNPANPGEIASWNQVMYSYDIDVDQSFLYSAGYLVDIFDLSNPANPSRISNLDTPGSAHGVAIDTSRELLMVADGDSGLTIVDVSDPYNPQVISRVATPGFVWDVDIQGTTVYLADLSTGLDIVDASDPLSPTLVGSYSGGGLSGMDVLVSGDRAYLAMGPNGFAILDISSPSSPVLLGSFDTGNARGLALQDTLLAVADVGSGVRLFDVSDPSSIQEVGYYRTPGLVYKVAMRDNYIFVPDYWGGFRILRFEESTGIQEGVSPANAFVGSIPVSEPGPYTIFDLRGKVVASGDNAGGTVRIRVNPGLYILRTPSGIQKVIVK